jgi:hypothetical protein
MGVQSPGQWLHWVLKFESSIRTVTAERVLLGARCRVINARNLQLGSHEGPRAGDTAAVPLTQRDFIRNLKNQCVGDATPT